jgi:hypothetical protein
MATGIDLRRVALQSGSEVVQRSGADPIGSAVGGFGQALVQTGQVIQQRQDKREAERQKMEDELQAERQKIYDSNSTAFIDRQIKAASSSVDIAMVEDPSDPSSWQKTFEESNAEVDKAFDQVAADMSSEKAEALMNRILDARQDEQAALSLATVKQEESAKNESWKLNAQLAADEENWEAMEEAIDQVNWKNEAQKREFTIDTKQAGQYNSLNREMLAIEDPDKLYEFEKDVLAKPSDELNKSQRNTLAMQAQQRANRIQKGYNNTMRGLKARLKRMDFPTVEEMNELIAGNQMDPDMLDSYYAMYDEAATKADYKQVYDKETLSPTFQRKETEILENYLLADEAPENVKLTRERKAELIEEINKLPLNSEWAKNDLYSLVFEAANESLREPDEPWVGSDPIGDAEREFRMDYNQKLQLYAGTGQLSQDFGRLFLANEARIVEEFKKEKPDPKLMDQLTGLVVNSMMNENLKRQLGVLQEEAE